MENKNKNFLESSFKKSLIVKIFLLIIAGSLLSGIVLYLMWHKELGETYRQAFHTLVGLRKVLFSSLIFTLLLQAVLFSAVIIFLTLFISHKIAGPIYRLEKSLDAIKNGDLVADEIRLRSNDQIQNLANSFNKMSSSIRLKVKEIKDTFHKVKATKDRLGAIMKDSQTTNSELEAIMSDLRDETEDLKKKMVVFKMGNNQ